MPAWLTFALAIAAAYALLKALAIGLTIARILRTPVRPPEVATVPRPDIPEAERLALDGAAADLAAAGFRHSHSCRLIPILDPGQPTYSDIYTHPDHPVAAFVSSGMAAGGMPYSLSLETLLPDGTAIVTLNRSLHACLPFAPLAQVEDARADSIEAMLAFHLARVSPEQAARAVRIPQDVDHLSRALLDATYRHWLEQGWIAHGDDPERRRLTLRIASRLALQLLQDAKHSKQPFQTKATSADAAAASGLAMFEQFSAQLEAQRRGSRSTRFAILVGSAVLAALAFGVTLSWSIVPTLLAVLALHEGGHYLAMRMVGYRDVSVFFVPFLGAATTGRKDDATPAQQLFVYLAGPVPGLVLGLACLLLVQSAEVPPGFEDVLEAFGWMASVLNFINLLPITPLDGGRIVEVFLFGRFPRARFGFALLGVLAFAALACFSFDGRGLDFAAVALALLLAVGLPFHWRTAAVLAEAQQRVQMPAQRIEALGALFGVLSQPRWHALPMAGRVLVARAALPTLLTRHPGPAATTVGLLLYLFFTVAPVGGAAYWWMQRWENEPVARAPTTPASRQRCEDESAAAEARVVAREGALHSMLPNAATDEERWNLLSEAAEDIGHDDPLRARAHLEEALKIAAAFPPEDDRAAHTKLQLAELAPAQERSAALQAVVQEYATGPTATRLVAVEALESLAYTDDSSPAARASQLRQALAIREQLQAPAGIYVVFARDRLAHALGAAGEPEQAEAVLRRGLTVADAHRGARDAAFCSAVRSIAWFLIAHGRAPEAAAILDERLKDPAGYRDGACRTALGWALLEAGNAPGALATFEQALREDSEPRSESWVAWLVRQVRPARTEHDPMLMLDAYGAALAAGDEQAQARWRLALESARDLDWLARQLEHAADSDTWEALRHRRNAAVLATLRPGPAARHARSHGVNAATE